MNISAKEINRQQGRVREQLTKFVSASGNISGEIANASEIIKSEDSELAQTLDKTNEAINNLQSKMVSNFTKLANLMLQYSNNTIENEENAVADSTQINNDLEEIDSVLDSIDI